MDLANPKQNTKNAGFTPDERKMGDTLEKINWVDTYRHFNPKKQQYTWWSYRFNARKRNIGWRIDYFFIKQKYLNKIKSAKIHDKDLGSDHCPISIEIT
jgi:exodeoxyribonuclease III